MSRHILQIVADGSPGGGTTMVLGLCKDLSQQGFRVSLVTAPDSAAATRAAELGVQVHGLDFFTSRLDPRLAKRLSQVVSDVQPDLIHVHGGRAANPFWRGALAKQRIPLIYTVHGYHFVKKPWAMRWLGRLAEGRIARRVDEVVFVSESDRRIAREHGIVDSLTKTRVVYNGVDTSELGAESPGADAARFDIVFVGRMVEQKNPLFMIDIMGALKQRGATLLMVGGGPLEGQVRRRAQQLGVLHLITFAGPLERPAALRAQASARIMVFPSLWEGLPIAPMEAMYLSLPVVASQIGGTDEVVIDGESGRLVPGFRADDYARAIVHLLDHDDEREALGARGKQIVEERFRRELCTRGYVASYQRHLARGSR